MEVHDHQLDSVSNLERSGSARIGSNRSSSARIYDDKAVVEITVQIGEGSVSVHKVKGDDSETATWAKRLERRASSLGSELSFRVMQVSQELKRLTSSKRFSQFGRITSGAERALKGLRFMSKNVCNESWTEVAKKFDELAVDGLLSRSQFGKCIGMTGSEEFSGHLFDGLARRRNITSSSVTKDKLQEFWEQLTDQSFDARLQTFFDLVDKNADGRITKEEVREVIAFSASANKLTKILDRLDEYTNLIMEGLDPDDVGYVEINSLEFLLLPASSQSFSFDLIHEVLGDMVVPAKEPNPIRRWYRKVKYFIEDNWRRIWVMALWFSVCAGLFTWKFIEYKHRAVFDVMGYCVTTAKGSGETLKFNMALILFPVCRNTITWLRTRTKLGAVVPFDDNINFHKVIAAGIAIGIGLHAGAHLTCDFPRLLHATDDEYEPLEPFFGENRPPNYWWFLKGTAGWTGIVMVVLMGIVYTLAQPCFRRNKLKLPSPLKKLTGFNGFWYSHHLFVIVYVLFVIHGIYLYLSQEWYKKTTWMYLAVPVTLYACERLIRSFRSRFNTVNILKVALHPGNVLELRLSKPEGFRYKSGQYIFVKCSAISLFQWHPFSLNSAPEDDYLSIHIKELGDWTSQIKVLFSKEPQPTTTTDESGVVVADMIQGNNIARLPRLLIDGPYGAPSQDYSEYDVLLLVGLGIGATPLISIVKDVLNNIKQQNAMNDVENGRRKINNKGKGKPFTTSRAYFHWVTPEQGHFEWFEGVLNEVTENDQNGVIELHNYCTSVYKEGDARSALITMLQSLQHEKNGVDIVAGTQAKTHFGRPDWGNVFEGIARNHPDQRVGVFYCGAPKLAGILRRLAQEFSRKTTTKFDFHKENF